MDRREFLNAAAGAAATAWLGHYFLGRPAWAGDEEVLAMGDVAEAYRRAKDLGKPLLVLVIPQQDDRKHDRGQVFGALLNHGGAGVYLDLALCEIVCATMADVAAQVKGVKIVGEPLMVLVETGGAEPRATAIDPQIGYDEPSPWKDGREKVDAFVKDRLDKVSEALRQGLLPAPGSLAERARLAEAKLPADEAKALRDAVRKGTPPQAKALDRGAAIARHLAEDPEARRPQVLEALAAAAQKRVTGAPPAGAKWAKSSGCGVSVEGGPGVLVGCGMGYVPKISERFLWFFTQ
jgi:hypothetical protein